MAKLLKIGTDQAATMTLPVLAKRNDVPLADYEAEMLLRVAKQ